MKYLKFWLLFAGFISGVAVASFTLQSCGSAATAGGGARTNRPGAIRSVELQWDPSPGSLQTKYLIEQSTDGINFTPTQTVPGERQSALIDGLTSGENYFFRVRALSLAGQSGYSEVLHLRVP